MQSPGEKSLEGGLRTFREAGDEADIDVPGGYGGVVLLLQ